MYPNVCRITSSSGQIYSKHDKKLLPHLSSILRNKKSRNQIDHEVLQLGSQWLIHGDKSRISSFSLIRNISIISAIDVILFTGPIILPAMKLDYSNDVLSDIDCDDIPEADFDEYDEFDDEELFAKIDGDAVLQIDDWISFILKKEEVDLVYGLRQKFGSILSRFFKDPVSFQMSHKDERILRTLFEVIEEEDEVEKYLTAKKSSKRFDESGSSDIRTTDICQSKEVNVEDSSLPAFATDIYKESIRPRFRKNKKKRLNRFEQNKLRFQDSNSVNNPLLKNETNQNSDSKFRESSQPSTSTNFWRNEEVLAADIGLLKLEPDHAVETNRYFLLTVKNMNHLYKSVFKHVWSFNTPLKKMRAIARETPRKIILLMHLQKVSAICGCGQFEAKGSGEYDIKLDENIFRFRPL